MYISQDMLCYSSNGVLYIKVGMFPAQQQRLQSGQGFVVGFTGSRIFSLHFFKMTATDIPQVSEKETGVHILTRCSNMFPHSHTLYLWYGMTHCIYM